jgi:uncharacterized protein
VIGALRGADPPDLDHYTPPAGGLHHAHGHESSRFRYCTNFAVTGQGLEGPSMVPRLEELGDSVLVVGDDRTLRVHVHTDEPDGAVALFQDAGEVSRLDVADMRAQEADRVARLQERATCGIVAAVSGEGMAALYRGLGARVVGGNPSTYELLAGIHAVPADEVIVLPNSQNVILAAGRAAELSEKPAGVVPTRAQQQGLAALVSFDSSRTVEENTAAVSEAAERLRTGGVARAARDDAQQRFRQDEAVGYAGEDLVAWGDPESTLAATLARVAEGCELLTCIAGEGAPLDRATVETLVPEGVELDYHEGGQPSWWWLLCAE